MAVVVSTIGGGGGGAVADNGGTGADDGGTGPCGSAGAEVATLGMMDVAVSVWVVVVDMVRVV